MAGEVVVYYEDQISCKCILDEPKDIIYTDCPKKFGGKGLKFSPTDLLAASIGSCVLTIMGIAAKKLGVDLTGTTVKVVKQMHETGRLGKVNIVVECPHDLPSKVKEYLEEAAKSCPVVNSLNPLVEKELLFKWRASQK